MMSFTSSMSGPGLNRSVSHEADTTDEQVNEYEQQREERIRRNRAAMVEMGVVFTAEALRSTAKGNSSKKPLGTRKTVPMKKPSRRCTRLASSAAPAVTSGASQPTGKGEEEELMTLEAYFKWKGEAVEPLVTDGHYRGWVCSEVAERYRIPDEDGAPCAAAGAASKPAQHGWSNARAHSATMLASNPNAYFYRHVAPNEEQATGEWTEEEHQLFMATARAHGAGDRWGLFASHIPQRVGYQCSAYYRERVIPQGLVFDPRFRMTRSGAAVFAG